jgi:hypothetical protein
MQRRHWVHVELTALPIPNPGARREWVVNARPRPIYPRERDNIAIEKKVGWALEASLDRCKKSRNPLACFPFFFCCPVCSFDPFCTFEPFPSFFMSLMFHIIVLTQQTQQKYPCLRWDPNPQSQQASSRRPTPYTARPLGSAFYPRDGPARSESLYQLSYPCRPY